MPSLIHRSICPISITHGVGARTSVSAGSPLIAASGAVSRTGLSLVDRSDGFDVLRSDGSNIIRGSDIADVLRNDGSKVLRFALN